MVYFHGIMFLIVMIIVGFIVDTSLQNTRNSGRLSEFSNRCSSQGGITVKGLDTKWHCIEAESQINQIELER